MNFIKMNYKAIVSFICSYNNGGICLAQTQTIVEDFKISTTVNLENNILRSILKVGSEQVYLAPRLRKSSSILVEKNTT